MDDITHALLGASLAGAVFPRRLGRWAPLIGGLAGIAADIDVFMTPLADPATPWEFHRHFTHALAFIPIGGLVAALPFVFLPSLRSRRALVIGAATIGYATHGLLDACTSWGTRLLWPFTDARFSWDFISIIDPIFTLALLAGLIWSQIARSSRPAMFGLACAMLYLGLGAVQHQRGLAIQQQLAAARGEVIVRGRGRVMPTLGNLIVWRSVYSAEGELHVDAIRVPLTGSAAMKRGEALPVLEARNLPPETSSHVRIVFERFARFADGYTASMPLSPLVIGDMRYSSQTSGFQPLWGIRIEPDNSGAQDAQVMWQPMMSFRREALEQLWREIARGDGFGPVE